MTTDLAPPAPTAGAGDRLRAAALAMFATSVALTIAAIALAQGVAGRPGLEGEFRLEPGYFVVMLAFAVGGLLLGWARPRNSVGWLLGLSGLLGLLCEAGENYGTRALVVPESDLPAGAYVLAVCAPLWVPSVFLPVTSLLVRYPTGVVRGRWAKRFDRAFTLGMVLFYTSYVASPDPVDDSVQGVPNPLQLIDPVRVALAAPAAVLCLLGLAAALVGAVVRMTRGPREERAALAWLAATAVLGVGIVFIGPAEEIGAVAFATIPVAIAVGVLRYRLLGIEVAVRRTLLYGTLTGLVLLAFVALTAALAAVLPSGPAPQVVAATLVAVGLTPARERVQRVVDRLFYGDRHDPISALARLGSPVSSGSSTPGQPDALPDVLSGIGTALRVPAVSVIDPRGQVLAAWRSGSGDQEVPHGLLAPLRFGGAELGELALGSRPGERELGRADRQLVDVIAPLVAAVVHATALAAAVRSEQERVLAATGAERARLRRELHDGLGPSLTGVGLGLEALESRAVRDERDAELVRRLRSEVGGALEEVRRIIDDLRPAVFDSHDLLTALRGRADALAGSGLRVTLDVPPALPPLRPEVEVAAYRIVEEALTNVVRHARANSVGVTIRTGPASLCLTVCDDGIGAVAARDGGVGLTSMRERAERLGGTFGLRRVAVGTAVEVELPLAPGSSPGLEEVS